MRPPLVDLWGHACNKAKRTARFFAASLTVFLLCLPLFSQTSQGTIVGGVFDQSGGAVAGAMVTVIDVARGVTRALTADGTGQYVATNLTPGTYTVRAEAKGFQTVEHSGVLLEVGQSIRVDLVVQPGEQSQTITVTSEIPAVNTTDSTLGGTVSNQSIVELPLNGRNFERLLDLRPGTVTAVGSGTNGSSSTNGLRTVANSFRMEGILGMPTGTGSSNLNASYRGGDTASLVPIDAIQEFSTTANPKAEYGFRDGSFVNIGIKSGTNAIHGSAYAFGRDTTATDAANPFTGQVTPATLEQFGATAGGPILKDKLFWFVSFEAIRDQNGNTSTVTAPTSVAGAGVGNSFVDACRSLGPAAINLLSAQLAGLNPATCVVSPASPTVENIFPFINSQSTTFFPGTISNEPLNNGLAKGDYALGAHNHVSGLVYISKSTSDQVPAVQLLPQYLTIGVNNAQQYSGSWAWTPNSTWVSDFRAGIVFTKNQTLNGDGNLLPGNPWPNGYGMPTGVTNPLYGGLPTITFSSFSGVLGANARTSTGGVQGESNFVEGVSYLHGNHAFKFGFELVRFYFNHNNYSNATGTINFTSLQNFLTGTTDKGSIFLGLAGTQGRANWYSGFFQDDWRIRPRLTLNLGLRYELYRPAGDVSDFLGNFDPNVNPATTPAVQRVGPDQPLKSLYRSGLGVISPRIGTAWDVRGNGKTVVRAGVGMFTAGPLMAGQFTTSPWGANFPDIGVNTSGTVANQNTFTNVNLSSAQMHWNTAANLPAGTTIFPPSSVTIGTTTYTGLTCTKATPCQTGAMDHDYGPNKSVQWNLDIQRALTNKLTLDVAYVGTYAFELSQQKDLNQPPIGTGWPAPVPGNNTFVCMTAPTYVCKPNTLAEVAAGAYSSKFPYLSQIDSGTNTSFSNYNGLQVTLQARTFHGLSFLSGYTYSHALIGPTGRPDTIGVIQPSDINNLDLNYGSSGLKHRFSLSPTYQIPGMKSPAQMLEGWSVNAILVLQSGSYLTFSDANRVDWLGTGEVLNLGIAGGTTQYWNFVGPRDAFAHNSAAPTKLTGNPALADATCRSAAEAPYAGNTQLIGLADAALFNGGCYKSNGGVLTPPAYGTLGNAGQGFFLGPSYKNVDFSVNKLWKIKERYSAQFRVEFFNLLNHTDFSDPGLNPSNSSFGFASSTPDSGNPVLGSGGPRHIQFGLKLSY